MKVIFLDIDGVLNGEYSKIYKKEDGDLDCKKAKLIKELVRKTGAKIVLSSSWKHRWDNTLRKKKLLKFFAENSLKLYDITPTFDGDDYEIIYAGKAVYERDFVRGREITQYLLTHDIESYVIFDDIIDLGKEHKDNLIVTKFYYGNGISKKDIKKALKILNSNKKH